MSLSIGLVLGAVFGFLFGRCSSRNDEDREKVGPKISQGSEGEGGREGSQALAKGQGGSRRERGDA